MSGIPYPPPLSNLPTFGPSAFDIAEIERIRNNRLPLNNIWAGINTFTQTIIGSITGSSNLATVASNVALTSDNTSGNYFIPFSKTANLINALFIDDTTTALLYNPSTSNLTASTFTGALSGNATTSTRASNITLTTDNTSGNYFIPFSKTTASASNALFIDDTTGPLTYNPSTSNLTATTFTGLCSTTGLVFLQTLTGTITGANTATTFTIPAIFNTTYKNYKIHLTFGQNNFTAYPSISLNGFSGLNVPTQADIYGYDLTSGALSAISLANQTLSTTPIQMTGSALANIQIEFDVFNVGYTTTFSGNIVRIVCNSVWNNPGVKGIRNIQVQLSQNSSSTITGLSLQSIMGLGNNPTWTAKIYGYK